MGKKEAKTNAIRILETMKIPYEARTYECDDFVDAAQIADKLGLDHAGMYKTITTVGKSGGYYVFVVPIDDEIDFKKAAKAAGEKSIEMLQGFDKGYRLYKGRLYINRNEKTVSYIYP